MVDTMLFVAFVFLYVITALSVLGIVAQVRFYVFGGVGGSKEHTLVATFVPGAFVAAGALIGGFVGFLVRPSVPLVGQLPSDVVLTRGAALTGLDIILKHSAETSFNYVLAGAVIGGVVFGIWGAYKAKTKPISGTITPIGGQ